MTISELQKLIPITGRNIDDVAGAYKAAPLFPHGAMDGFLSPEFAEALLQEFPKFEAKRAYDDNGKVGGKATREDVRSIGPNFRKLDDLLASKEFLDFMSRYTGIPGLMFDSQYCGGGTHESVEGEELAVHLDFNNHPHNGLHRRANMIIYLNKEWGEGWGGDLLLHKDPWGPRSHDQIISIPPVFNRAGVFTTSEHSWHGFPPIKPPPHKKGWSRKSIAVFFYTKERADAVAPRSTVYCERRLPETLQAGKILSEEDCREAHSLITRRDGLLKLLYRRELQMSGEIQGLKWMNGTYRKQVELNLYNLNKHLSHDFAARGLAPVYVDRHTDESYFVSPHTVAHPVFFPGFQLKCDVERAFKPGDIAVVSTDLAAQRKPDYFMVCQVIEALSDDYFIVAQKNSPAVSVVPRRLLKAKLSRLLDWNQREMEIDPPFLGFVGRPPVGLRVRCWISKVFFRMNQAKNVMLRNVQSPLLWKLSGLYREALNALGVQVPAILPRDSR